MKISTQSGLAVTVCIIQNPVVLIPLCSAFHEGDRKVIMLLVIECLPRPQPCARCPEGTVGFMCPRHMAELAGVGRGTPEWCGVDALGGGMVV